MFEAHSSPLRGGGGGVELLSFWIETGWVGGRGMNGSYVVLLLKDTSVCVCAEGG